MQAKSEMNFLAHRGWWQKPEEKNTQPAFDRAFAAGFGIETDFRDATGNLVISHDPPLNDAPPAETMLKAYAAANRPGTLAINIKADGLQRRIKGAMERFEITRYFVFDMSVPDMIVSLREEMPVFTRQSEVEPTPALYAKATGVWIDMLERDWITESTIADHLSAGKRVGLISPELHKRKHLDLWTKMKDWTCVHSDQFFLCTDLPQHARKFFYGTN